MISVVMMSYLGDYPGARSNPIPKFNRAVQSVVDQKYKDWELIIVSDGCELTNQEYTANWSQHPQIQLVKTIKSTSRWPGSKRQIGIDHSSGTWITYLDADDIFTKDRLYSAYQEIKSSRNKVIFDDVQNMCFEKSKLRRWDSDPKMHLTPNNMAVSLKHSTHIPELGSDIYYYSDVRSKTRPITGVFRIFHRKDINVKWQDQEKPGEDNAFIRRLKNVENYTTKSISGYIITHSAARGFDI